MRISRYKKSSKIISFYINNFGFREPLQVLIDATFCQEALVNKIDIREQLSKYLQSELKLLTTQCIIQEAENLGPKVFGALQIVKRFTVHKCGHEKNPISGADCLKAMVTATRYMIASQDRDLQTWLRKRAGQPIIYLHKHTPVLEPPSPASKKRADKKVDKQLDVRKSEEERLQELKKKECPIVEKVFNRKKKAKNPNPLSCKKKKRKIVVRPDSDKQEAGASGIKNKTIDKNKKKRKKLPLHVKEHLKATIVKQ